MSTEAQSTYAPDFMSTEAPEEVAEAPDFMSTEVQSTYAPDFMSTEAPEEVADYMSTEAPEEVAEAPDYMSTEGGMSGMHTSLYRTAPTLVVPQSYEAEENSEIARVLNKMQPSHRQSWRSLTAE